MLRDVSSCFRVPTLRPMFIDDLITRIEQHLETLTAEQSKLQSARSALQNAQQTSGNEQVQESPAPKRRPRQATRRSSGRRPRGEAAELIGKLLSDGVARTAAQISKETALSVATVNYNLTQLRTAGRITKVARGYEAAA